MLEAAIGAAASIIARAKPLGRPEIAVNSTPSEGRSGCGVKIGTIRRLFIER